MKNSAKKHLLKIKPYVPGKPIEEVKRELGLGEVSKLASNENPFSPSPKVLKAISRAAKGINRYPDSGCFLLRKRLAQKLRVKPEQLIFGNGSDEVLVLAIRAFVSPGDEVIVAKPTFLVYGIASRVEGAKIVEVPLQGFRYDLDAMRKAITKKTKIIFIGNPDNPAGDFVTQKELVRFLKSVSPRVLVVIDEAYFEYVSSRSYPKTINLLKAFKNLFVTRTFSKMFGLAGLRIGYGIGNLVTLDILNRIREPFNVNSIAQAAALACLDDEKDYLKKARFFEQQRQLIYNRLKKLGLEFVETSTNFILIKTNQGSAQLSRKLLKKGIIVRDMRFWGLNSYIRVSIGTENENRKFLKVLSQVI